MLSGRGAGRLPLGGPEMRAPVQNQGGGGPEAWGQVGESVAPHPALQGRPGQESLKEGGGPHPRRHWINLDSVDGGFSRAEAALLPLLSRARPGISYSGYSGRSSLSRLLIVFKVFFVCFFLVGESTTVYCLECPLLIWPTQIYFFIYIIHFG